jgi:hypothetical protein
MSFNFDLSILNTPFDSFFDNPNVMNNDQINCSRTSSRLLKSLTLDFEQLKSIIAITLTMNQLPTLIFRSYQFTIQTEDYSAAPALMIFKPRPRSSINRQPTWIFPILIHTEGIFSNLRDIRSTPISPQPTVPYHNCLLSDFPQRIQDIARHNQTNPASHVIQTFISRLPNYNIPVSYYTDLALLEHIRLIPSSLSISDSFHYLEEQIELATPNTQRQIDLIDSLSESTVNTESSIHDPSVVQLSQAQQPDEADLSSRSSDQPDPTSAIIEDTSLDTVLSDHFYSACLDYRFNRQEPEITGSSLQAMIVRHLILQSSRLQNTMSSGLSIASLQPPTPNQVYDNEFVSLDVLIQQLVYSHTPSACSQIQHDSYSKHLCPYPFLCPIHLLINYAPTKYEFSTHILEKVSLSYYDHNLPENCKPDFRALLRSHLALAQIQNY